MNRFIERLFRKMAEMITGFWVVDEARTEVASKSYPDYPDYPVSLFGPLRLISKETIHELMKPTAQRK